MRETEGPVVVLFIAIIIILVYSYISDSLDTNRRLHETIDQQADIINKTTEENTKLKGMLQYIYYSNYNTLPDNPTH